MKKFLINFATLMLVFAIVGCSATSTKSNKKKKHKDKSPKETEETIDPDETEETEEPEVTEETEETTIETEVTEPDTTDSNDATSTITVLSSEYDYLDFQVEPFSYSEECNDGTFNIYTYQDYIYAPVEANDDLALAINDINDEQDKSINKFIEDSVEISTYADKSEYQYYSYNAYTTVSRTDSQVFSAYIETFKYESMSGNSTNTVDSYNFDATTGLPIALSSIITDEDNFKSNIIFNIENYYDVSSDFEATIKSTDLDDFCYVFTPIGIDVVFAPDEVVPGYECLRVSFDYRFQPELFAYDLWSNYPENRILSGKTLDASSDCIDIDEENSIFLLYNTDDYDTYTSISVYYNDVNFTIDDMWAYMIEPYYVKSNGNEYLYLAFTEENDWKECYVYNITDPDNITFVGVSSCNLVNFINPDFFYCSKRIQRLSTVNGVSPACIGSEGLIERYTNLWIIEGYIEFPLIDDVDGYISSSYDFDTPYTAESGTTLYYYATDDNSFVVLSDGSELIYFDSFDYDDIGGKSIFDVVDNDYILFAG